MSLRETLFLRALEKTRVGSLELVLPRGRRYRFNGAAHGPHATLEIRDMAMIGAIVSGGGIGLGESYMRGQWETDDLCALLRFGAVNAGHMRGLAVAQPAFRLAHRALHRLRPNSKTGSRKNIHAHYDLGNEFYQLWLDESMTYSSALYTQENITLRQAQAEKYGRIIHRLGGQGHVLEIGCGWGGFAEEAANAGMRVTGLTISDAQAEYARSRLKTRADIALRDYRDERGRYDHIVSIEMFEAVGERYWPVYFRAVKERLKSGGKAMIQAITIADGVFPEYRKRCDFIQRHIFPGGMLPSPTVFEHHARAAGLTVTDAFSFGQHYARTLAEWLVRFDAAAAGVRAMGFSEEFIRKWRFYLAYCHGGFFSGRTDVVQYELMHA